MAVQDFALRTLHIKLYPPPRAFAERREVLRVLSTYGEVAMLRSFKYHPVNPVANAFMMFYTSQSSAQKLLNASPITYELMSSTFDDVGGTQDRLAPPKFRVFTLNASSTNFSHELFLAGRYTNPLHRPFTPIRPEESALGSILKKSVTYDSVSGPGMIDWETDHQRWRLDVRTAEMDTPRSMFRKARQSRSE